MIIEVNVKGLRKGMYAAQNIYSKGGTLLFARGSSLEKRHIPILHNMGVETIEVSLEPILDVFLPDNSPGKNDQRGSERGLAKFFNTSGSRENEIIYTLLKEEANLLIRNSLLTYINSSIKKSTCDAIENVMTELINRPQILDYLVEVKFIDGFTFRHSINVAVLSLITASIIEIGKEDMYKIAIGALLHDIGKKKIPYRILLSEGNLSPEEKQIIEQHSTQGYEYLIRQQSIPEEVALIALQHHERIDGTGYPFKIKDKDIHLYSQIVGISDVFEAMTSDRNYRKGYNSIEVFEFLMAVPGSLFSEEVVKALLGSVPVYKIGSVVELSSGECGMVIQSNFSFPTRPTIRIMFNRHGLRVRNPVIFDLSEPENTTVQIVRCFS